MRASNPKSRATRSQVQLGAGRRAVCVGLVRARRRLLHRFVVQLLENGADNTSRCVVSVIFPGRLDPVCSDPSRALD